MKKLALSCYLVTVFLMSPTAFANTLVDVGGTAGSWQNWVPPDGSTLPDWDGTSWDSWPKNIGYYLQSTQGAGNGWQFWANNAAGNADPDFVFSKTTPSQNAALQLEASAFAGTNELWWYDKDSSYMEKIFSGSDGAGISDHFTPSNNWGLALHTQQGNWFYTESTRGNDPGFQHFTVFRDSAVSSPIYWIGVEDLVYSGSDKDYQDIVFKLTPAPVPEPVPEPGTILLLGFGLIGLARYRRKKSFQK